MGCPEPDPCRPDSFSTGTTSRVYGASLCFYRRGSVRVPPCQSHTAHRGGSRAQGSGRASALCWAPTHARGGQPSPCPAPLIWWFLLDSHLLCHSSRMSHSLPWGLRDPSSRSETEVRVHAKPNAIRSWQIATA